MKSFPINKKGIIILSAGMILAILLIFSDSLFTKEKQKEVYSENKQFIDEYTDTIEKKLKDLIESIDGVGNVKVLVTLKSGNEILYATDKGSDGGQKYVINDKSPVYISEKLPEIQGVAVVCKGGSDLKLQKEITSLIVSSLGIYSTHVYVTE